MKFEKRVMIEAFIVSLIIIIGWLIFTVVRGFILTRNYVPDVAQSYESIDNLQHKVSFGVIQHPTFPVYLIAFILVAVVYCLLRIGIRRLRR